VGYLNHIVRFQLVSRQSRGTLEIALSRGKVMTVPRKARGRPFQPGNPGRPLGSKNKATQIFDQVEVGEAEQLREQLFDRAKAGDVACLRMVIDRLWPVRKGQPLNLDMPAIKTSDDVLGAIASVWDAIGEGRLTADEADALSLVVQRTLEMLQLHNFSKRLDELEQQLGPAT
jgi:hypothetical protein